MTDSHLVALTLERFKCFAGPTRIDLAPLTIVLGRNNSGKSSLIQSLLLLKQTLAEPRPEVPLHLDGTVSALNLRELTTDWPKSGPDVPGPVITLTWRSVVQIAKAREDTRWADPATLADGAAIKALKRVMKQVTWPMVTTLKISTHETDGTIAIAELELTSDLEKHAPLIRIARDAGQWRCWWRGQISDKIEVDLDHFVPYLRIDRSKVGPRVRQRAWYHAHVVLFEQPLEALKRLLSDLQYLGSTRSVPPPLYRSSNVTPQEIGATGDLAAQLLHRRQRDLVHYPAPLEVGQSSVTMSAKVRERPLVVAVNDILDALAIGMSVSVHDVQEVGFRLMFGSASLAHVGRGLTYLLPLVELGLIAEPLRFQAVGGDLTFAAYNERCNGPVHIAFEEPEAHVHPKVQSRLAHWFVSLAMASRRLIVETHSDHLVRRLRGLVARAGTGSELERWLLENVVILEVEQDAHGHSTVTSTRLTAEGRIGERWPTDFMDEASEEDSAIYYAGMAKAAESGTSETLVLHDKGPEPEVES